MARLRSASAFVRKVIRGHRQAATKRSCASPPSVMRQSRGIMAADQFAITVLIESRSRDLGQSRAELVRRPGFKNIAKGMRRLDSLLAGDLETTQTTPFKRSSISVADGCAAPMGRQPPRWCRQPSIAQLRFWINRLWKRSIGSAHKISLDCRLAFAHG